MTKETILVIDDSRENHAFVTEYVLEPRGFRHLSAFDGQEGLEMALKHKPDLLLLDLQMPRLSGIQVMEQLSQRNVDIPIILMTFHGSEEIAIEVYRMGVKDYVKKPYHPDEMAEAIERSLSETRLRREKDDLINRLIQANSDLKRRIRELNILYNVGKNVTSIVDMNRLLPQIVEATIQITQAEECHLYLAEDERLVCRAEKTQLLAHAKSVDEESKDPIARHVIRQKQALLLSHEQLAKFPSPTPPISAAYTILMVQGRVLGALGVLNFTRNARQFDDSDMAMLSALSDYAAIAIENSHNYSALRTSNERMQETFERFVPPPIVKEALSLPEGVQLGGKRQEISVLFADIRGYTTWSETVEPETVIETLNHYLSLAAGVVLGWEGTLDKYFGDGLMAIFNAPNPQPDHVHRATDAALAIIRAAQEVNVQHGHQLAFSIGVHVGEAVVGYIGTERALNYTALGDTVNLAKRLQEYAAPGQILVDESVVKRLGNQIRARALGELKVKGRKNPAFAYELLDVKA